MNRGSLAAFILAFAAVVAGACKKAEQPAQQATAMGGADYKVVV